MAIGQNIVMEMQGKKNHLRQGRKQQVVNSLRGKRLTHFSHQLRSKEVM